MGKYYDVIIKIKPGVTGPWQIRGRSNISFEDRLKIDAEYIQNMSLKNDIKMVLKTFTKVVNKDGAI